MAQTVRTGALVIVPLAAAVQLHGSAITLPDGSPTCVEALAGTFSNNACSARGGATVEALPLSGTFLTGVDINFNGGGFVFDAPSGDGNTA